MQSYHISNLDISRLVNLEDFSCNGNKISTLDSSNLSKLTYFDCSYNQITYVDLSKATLLNTTQISPQAATITLTGKNNNYTSNILMNSGIAFGSTAITYNNGVLTSNDKTVTSTTFTSPTGHPGLDLTGTLTFDYKEAPPVIGGTVQITGTAKAGEILTADTSKLTSTPAANLGNLSYQWYRDGAAITGATAATYKVTNADVSKRITVTVAAANCTGSVTSLAVTPVASGNGGGGNAGGGAGGGNGAGGGGTGGGSGTGTGSGNNGNGGTGSGTGTGTGSGNGSAAGNTGDQGGQSAGGSNTTPNSPSATPATGDILGTNATQVIWLFAALGLVCLVAALRMRKRQKQ
jgi:hypothetical protein